MHLKNYIPESQALEVLFKKKKTCLKVKEKEAYCVYQFSMLF